MNKMFVVLFCKLFCVHGLSILCEFFTVSICTIFQTNDVIEAHKGSFVMACFVVISI